MSIGFAAGLVSIVVAMVFYLSIQYVDLENPEEFIAIASDESRSGGGQVMSRASATKRFARVAKLVEQINQGAQSFLNTEYFYLAIFVVVVGIAIAVALIQEDKQEFGAYTMICFFAGAILSGLAGYFGMLVATEANGRTTLACVDSMKRGLEVSFASGAVMSNVVVGFGIVGVSILYVAFSGDKDVWSYISGFGFGASSIALFARVGGGIFTKAADVGADLVGKVEAGIPEDDPRNPAVIADNVGDNVGDVAGMGADLFESFVGSIIAACTIAETQFADSAEVTQAAIALPFWVAGFGIVCALIGTFIIRTVPLDNGAGLGRLLFQLNAGIYTSAVLVVCLSIVATQVLFDGDLAWELWACIVIGLVAGIIVGAFTEYCTAYDYAPTQAISESSTAGGAPVIIMGMGVGMISVTVPTFALAATVIACNELAGLYGIAIAAVGLLSTLGVTLATDAYGPVADNAGGIAEMADLPSWVRDRTDALDSLGNTTAATGKGFAIGSAVLTSVGLIAAFLQTAGVGAFADTPDNERFIPTLDDPVVLTGVLIGASLPFVFAALTMLSVNTAAKAIIDQVRLHFAKKPELLEDNSGDQVSFKVVAPEAAAQDGEENGEGAAADAGDVVVAEGTPAHELFEVTEAGVLRARPVMADKTVTGTQRFEIEVSVVKEAVVEDEEKAADDAMDAIFASVSAEDSEECVKIATAAAVEEMILPGLIAVFAPIVAGFLLGTPGLAGLLVGSLTSGFMLALTMSNAGGAWDNAKKLVEKIASSGDEESLVGEFPSFVQYGIKSFGTMKKKLDKWDLSTVEKRTQAYQAFGLGAQDLEGGERNLAAELAQAEVLAERYHEKHSAVVTGDTVGDPYKDTSGPALNILIKLMSVVSLVFAPAFKSLDEHGGFSTTGTIVAVVISVVLGLGAYLLVSCINGRNAARKDEADKKMKEARAAKRAADQQKRANEAAASAPTAEAPAPAAVEQEANAPAEAAAPADGQEEA